jgi:predicted Rossmann fold nucleotide-binding protein DprA/Smf involved in DNA uptake
MGKPWTLPASYEGAYAAAMRALAEKEGRVGILPKTPAEQEASKSITKFASDETLAAVKMLAVRPLTSEQIANVLGIHPNSVSNRLASLQRADVIRCVGRKREGKWQQLRNVWGPGPNMETWLQRAEDRRAV